MLTQLLLAIGIPVAIVGLIAWHAYRKAPEPPKPAPPPEAKAELPAQVSMPEPAPKRQPRRRLPTAPVFVHGSTVALQGTGRGFFVGIVGESHYQSALRACLDGCDIAGEVPVIVAAEPTNQYDAKAVVIKSSDGSTLGYLPRALAARHQPALLELASRNVTATCVAKVYGGEPDRPSVGLWLDLDGPVAVARALGLKYARQKRVEG